METMKVTSEENIVNEYKTYVNHLLKNGFDFSTWYQHQYGKEPRGIDVKTFINFDIHNNIGNK